MYFIDIETVSGFKDFASADHRTQDLFHSKFRYELQEYSDEQDLRNNLEYLYEEKAAVLAEFNRIVCVSLGVVTDIDKNIDKLPSIYIKSFVGEERDILIALSTALEKCYSLCAHFGKGFDYPVLCRKYVIHRLPIPRVLDISGLKPWEVPLSDTQDMWKFGDMRHSVSLDLLAHCFGLPSPKEGMHGADVSKVFYAEGVEGLNKIRTYCEGDVRTLINVYRVMNQLEPIL